MNRLIEFRGISVYENKWVYGSLLQSEIASNGYVQCEIHERYADSLSISKHRVIPETVGRFTGLKDKLGNKIFEDDILEIEGWKNNITSLPGAIVSLGMDMTYNPEFETVIVDYDGAYVRCDKEGKTKLSQFNKVCIVIGNIHEKKYDK